jgi:hypothetical protein
MAVIIMAAVFKRKYELKHDSINVAPALALNVIKIVQMANQGVLFPSHPFPVAV